MKILSLLLNILNIGILGASVVALLPTAMIFDTPGSEKSWRSWLVYAVWMLFPLVVGASC